MGRLTPAASILLVALILGITLGTIFLQLMSYSLAMKDTREFWIWAGEWIGTDLFLTAFARRWRRSSSANLPGKAGRFRDATA